MFLVLFKICGIIQSLPKLRKVIIWSAVPQKIASQLSAQAKGKIAQRA